MRSYLVHFFVFIFISAGVQAGDFKPASPERVGLSSERLEYLDKSLQSYVDKNQLPGSVMLIARKGRIAYQKAFGWRDKEAGDAMETNSMFRIASQTKALTSVGIMILQERGELLVTDPVSKYLPEYAATTVAVDNGNGGYDVVPANRQITIRDLLTHSAGISYGAGPAAEEWKKAGIYGWYLADRTEPMRDIIAKIATLPQAAQPGEKFVYGYNTDILGIIIEVISGKTLANFLSENLFTPLAMNDTYFFVPEDKFDRVSVVYSSTDKGIERAANPGEMVNGSHIGQGHYMKGPRSAHAGGAGVVSTAKDYGRFLQMMLNNGELDGKRILSRKSVELMTTTHFPMKGAWGRTYEGIGFGLGFTVLDDLGGRGTLGSEGEYGWGGAYHSRYWVDPAEDLLVVYLTQLIPAKNIDDQGKIRALVYQAIVD